MRMIAHRLLVTIFVTLGVSTALGQERGEASAEPVDREFARKAAQAYYDALVKKDFAGTAAREVFVLNSTPPDLPAYSRAMAAHPYASATGIVVNLASIDSSSARLSLAITTGEGTKTNLAVWSRTGTPAKWVAPMTTLTMAGMPGHSIITDEDGKKAPKITSTAVFTAKDKQAGIVTGRNDGPIRFARPPKVMPNKTSGGNAYVLGYIANTGTVAATGIAVKVEVKSEAGEILETKIMKPAGTTIEPGKDAKFAGNLEHLDPGRTEFSLIADPAADKKQAPGVED